MNSSIRCNAYNTMTRDVGKEKAIRERKLVTVQHGHFLLMLSDKPTMEKTTIPGQ